MEGFCLSLKFSEAVRPRATRVCRRHEVSGRVGPVSMPGTTVKAVGTI